MTKFSSEISGRTFSHMLGHISRPLFCARNKDDSCFTLTGTFCCKYVQTEVLTLKWKRCTETAHASVALSVRGHPPPGEVKPGIHLHMTIPSSSSSEGLAWRRCSVRGMKSAVEPFVILDWMAWFRLLWVEMDNTWSDSAGMEKLKEHLVLTVHE